MAKVFRLTKPGAARKGGVNFLGKLLMSTRLAKLIRLLASDKSGEVVAAAGAINRALAAAGLDIHRLADVVERSPLVPGQMPPPPCDDSTAGDWRAMRRFCADHDTLLSARERAFVLDIKRWRGRLTPKQHDWLVSIYQRLRDT